MSQNVHLHLRTLRRKSGLTQADVASLLHKAGRNRVSCIEQGKTALNAEEIIAYGLIFGPPAQKLLRRLQTEIVESVMQRAYRFHTKLERDTSPRAQHKRQIAEQMLARAMGKGSKRKIV